VPELPELEVIRARLRLALAGRRIAGATLLHPAVLKTFDPPLDALRESHIMGVDRLGKFLCLNTDRKLHLCIHLMLSGRLGILPASSPMTKRQLLALHLDDGSDLRLSESGTRRRVGVHLVAEPGKVERIASLGLDPMGPEFTLRSLRSALARRNQTVKRFLTDQRAIGGIGNAYSGEILFEARLSPFLKTSQLRPEDTIRLFTSVKKVLHEAILRLKALDHLPERRDRTFLKVHDRLGQPCTICGEEIRRVSYKESTTFYCPKCQTGGKILADRRLSRLLK
jgi:formamidopyrimidine-DNA glycosylase